MTDEDIQESDSNFNNARMKAVWSSVFSILSPEKKEMLSFYDIKKLIKPKAEFYKGIRSVPIDKIVGSEGRYRDFTRAFLPKREHLRIRWRSVDIAAIKDITLPPIRLFKIGETYFVRDGNHRVSVARQRGQLEIDAEITEITSEIKLLPEMTIEDLRKEVIGFELKRIKERTGLAEWVNFEKIKFTSPGRYEEILRHILGHRAYLRETNIQISLEQAAHSWFMTVYMPVIDIILNENLIDRFPDRTEADLYIWVMKNWNELDDRYGEYPKIQKNGKGPGKFGINRLYIQLKKIISMPFRKK